MSKFENQFNELKEKVKKGSTTYSRGELIGLTDAMLNDPDFSYEFVSKKGDGYETETRKPVQDLRNSMKKVVKKEFGISEAELTKLDGAQLPKDFAAAVTEIGGVSIKKYMEAGKTYKFPVTSANEATMKISVKDVPEVTKETSKIVEQEDGKFVSVPTGKTVKTEAHLAAVAKNSVPGWLKKEV